MQNVYKNLKTKAQIEHQFYLQAKKSLPELAKSMGMDFKYFASNTYAISVGFPQDPEMKKLWESKKDELMVKYMKNS